MGEKAQDGGPLCGSFPSMYRELTSQRTCTCSVTGVCCGPPFFGTGLRGEGSLKATDCADVQRTPTRQFVQRPTDPLQW